MKKVSMLVVEDEAIMREALVDYFSREGHHVDSADDGDKALENVNLMNYKIMIIDLKLPGRDGISVLKEARMKNPGAKVIIITAFPSKETKMEALREGAVDYLQKPFELEYLETLIRQAYEVEELPAPDVEEFPAPEVEEVPVPIFEEPIVEEKIVNPCIWMQAGLVQKRMCSLGYQCLGSCKFHAAMMKKEKIKNDPRIKPFIDKLHSLLGGRDCRYTMNGAISIRSCPRLYHCERCEFDQIFQDEIDRQRAIKNAQRKNN
jgi:CheY-like chemotaxis protein